ncbi:MAG: amidohydrolase family protein, partial [Mycetocola sp.]
MELDLVVRNGFVIDGSGSPGRRGDVGVRDGRIVAVGEVDGRGAQEIDADGHVVAPGFIDGHTHMDAQVFWDAPGSPSCWHGVTSVVMGNCGFTLAPARAGARELVVRNLERAEDISAEAMAAGIEWSWESFSEYLGALDRLDKGINYGTQIGHSALRTWAMGERAFEGAATADDITLMEAQLADALAAGAIGFTTSRSGQHETSDGRPVASRVADWEEVRRLVASMAGTGALFEVAMASADLTPDSDGASTNKQVHELALETGVTVTFGVLPHDRQRLALVDATVAAGGSMFGQTHSRGASIVSSFKTKLPFDWLPEWQEVRAQPLEQQRLALSDPATRARLVEAAQQMGRIRDVGAGPRTPDYELSIVWQNPIPPNPSVADVARQRRIDPVEAMIELALETNFEQCFVQNLVPYTDSQIIETMRHPNMVMTFSDTGAHVSQIADPIHTYLLAYWVRERQEFTLEEAVA